MSDSPAQTSRTALSSPRLLLSAGALSLLIVGFMVFQVTSAAFTDTTSNTGNSWTAGEVEITDDADGVAMFEAYGLVPGWSQTEDIEVANSSSVDTEVAFFAEGLSGDLAQYLNVAITAGSGEDAEEIFNGPFTVLAETHSDFESGVTSQAPASGPSTTYTFTVSFPDAEGVNEAQGESAALNFVWEARST